MSMQWVKSLGRGSKVRVLRTVVILVALEVALSEPFRCSPSPWPCAKLTAELMISPPVFQVQCLQVL